MHSTLWWMVMGYTVAARVTKTLLKHSKPHSCGYANFALVRSCSLCESTTMHLELNTSMHNCKWLQLGKFIFGKVHLYRIYLYNYVELSSFARKLLPQRVCDGCETHSYYSTPHGDCHWQRWQMPGRMVLGLVLLSDFTRSCYRVHAVHWASLLFAFICTLCSDLM